MDNPRVRLMFGEGDRQVTVLDVGLWDLVNLYLVGGPYPMSVDISEANLYLNGEPVVAPCWVEEE